MSSSYQTTRHTSYPTMEDVMRILTKYTNTSVTQETVYSGSIHTHTHTHAHTHTHTRIMLTRTNSPYTRTWKSLSLLEDKTHVSFLCCFSHSATDHHKYTTCVALGRDSLSKVWMTVLEAVRLRRLLGQATFCRLFLKSIPKLNACKLFGKVTFSRL